MDEQSLKSKIFKFLGGELTKLALKKILGSAAMGGFKAWAIKFAVEYLYEEYAVPMMQYLIRKGQLYYDKEKGEIKYKKLEEAKKDGDESTYNDVIDNV